MYIQVLCCPRDIQILRCAYSGDIVQLESLLSKDTSLDPIQTKEGYSTTLIHLAAANSYKVVNFLLEKHGVSVNFQNSIGRTALHEAAYARNIDVVELLLAKGANVHAQDWGGNTPLHQAVCEGMRISISDVSQVIQMLLDRGANIYARNIKGENALCLSLSEETTPPLLLTLLRRGAYSCRSQRIEEIMPFYWENQVLNIASFSGEPYDLVKGKLLLLAGVPVPQGKILPIPLAKIKWAIDTTMKAWLRHLNLSQDELRAAIPRVLKALPSVLSWVKQFKALEIKQAVVPEGASDVSSAQVSNVFFWGVAQVQKSLELPDELLLGVQASVMQAKVAERTKEEFGMESQVAQYLVAEVISDLEKCTSFHDELFKHHWDTPLPPPATPFMKSQASYLRLLSKLQGINIEAQAVNISTQRENIEQLLQEGAYSYRRDEMDSMIAQYLSSSDALLNLDSSFYKTLILAGARPLMTADLLPIRNIISWTVLDLLDRLPRFQNISVIAPNVLCALPIIVDWLQLLSENSDPSFFFGAIQNEENQEVFKGLGELQKELTDKIQENFNQKS